MERKLKDKLVDGRFEGQTPGNSRRMSAIRGKGNRSTEVRLRLMLVRAGFRGWKVHPAGITGKPDFYFPDRRVAVFVDGCFWHGCPRCGHVPKANTAYWKAKIERNRRRDHDNALALAGQGVRVVRIWEHELRDEPEKVIEAIRMAWDGAR
jgi:DNA mismatch endonuclease (patch repair protein)